MDLGAIERILRGAGEENGAANGSNGRRPSGLGGHAFLAAGTGGTTPVEGPDRPPLGLRSATAPSPPRTAFLRTRIAPAVRDVVPSPTGPVPGPAQAQPRRDPMDLLDAGEPLLTAEELDAFFNPTAEAGPPDPEVAPTGSPVDVVPGAPRGLPTEPPPTEPRPAWLKRQVADLADLVQALDMRARSNHSHLAFEGELTRLRQFTRTIGFVASPPPRGSQDFDLASFVEEQLGQIAGQSPDAPRLLFRRRGPEGSTGVTADRSLVALALDALLQTAVACASSGDVVRVSVEGGERGVTARIDFPAGPLAGIHPAEIQRPYALRSVLPEIGPNAIAAAGAIAVGQGGDLTLEELSKGRLAFAFAIS